MILWVRNLGFEFFGEVAGRTAGGLDGPHVPQGVGRLQRIVEQTSFVEQSGQAIHRAAVFADDFEPQFVHPVVHAEEAMGAEVELHHGYVEVTVPGGRLKGSDVALGFPTHTGTENLMCAAVLAKGRTTLTNCAREPEVEELARVLNKMGARIEGAGTSVISIEGVDSLHPVDHAIIPDRIEAGTFMVAAAATAGDLLLEGIGFEPLEAVIAKLREAGAEIEVGQTFVDRCVAAHVAGDLTPDARWRMPDAG